MKKLLFAIAICGFVFTSCGNKTKAATEEKACCSKEKTEVSADLKKDCEKGCTHTAEAKKACCDGEKATTETAKTECCSKEKTEATAEAKTECKGDCTKDCCKK
ncbi:hypothetical protein L3049_16500 [Labilibaculum sp. DW002]|uniref:Lipoprotein n=1 Tax=Paralabilibaculum antarcticum TaxID=2912572 RepID=A0ABT5VYJ1_9BACT|nr:MULTISPECIES: hypothetical protein [unclassified Labilibaculum]MBI9058767.1 hypothetical protein [Labilibaculum sp.]MDE5419593.1 hypothetical protein [Labilibaculum sp. DW002]